MTTEERDTSQTNAWENIKELVSDGFEVFHFNFNEDGTVHIRAVKGLVAESVDNGGGKVIEESKIR